MYVRVCKHVGLHVLCAYSYMYVRKCARVSVVVCVFICVFVCVREHWYVRVYLQADGPL